MVKQYFTYRESSTPNEFMIVPKDYNTFPFNIKNGGSYNVAPARVLGLSYPNYLRFLLNMFPNDVIVRGKGSIYPIAYWKKDKTLFKFIELLNAKLSLAMKGLEVVDGAVVENNTGTMPQV